MIVLNFVPDPTRPPCDRPQGTRGWHMRMPPFGFFYTGFPFIDSSSLLIRRRPRRRHVARVHRRRLSSSPWIHDGIAMVQTRSPLCTQSFVLPGRYEARHHSDTVAPCAPLPEIAGIIPPRRDTPTDDSAFTWPWA
jgi:hypothetical protein